MDTQIFSEFPRIAAALLTEPWMIVPSHHRVMVERVDAFLQNRADVFVAPAQGIRLESEPLAPGAINRIATFDKASGLAVINARGIIGKGLSGLALDCGGLCLDQIEGSLDQLRSMPVKAVAIHFNSPGGTVNGTEEAGAAIRSFSQEVAPVFAYSDTMTCSAAYWLAVSADSFHVAPSAYVGSIGVYSYMIDSSAQWAKNGLKMILASSGPQKAAGIPGVEVTDEQIAEMRDGVARIASRFFSYVRSRRAGIGDEALTGAYWPAQDGPPALHDGFMRSRSDHLAHAYSMRRERAK